MATVLTRNYKYELDILDSDIAQQTQEEAVSHYLEEIPVVEYQNNKLAAGDFEMQIPLIDAYNALMSDRVTDKEQFIDAILAISWARCWQTMRRRGRTEKKKTGCRQQ